MKRIPLVIKTWAGEAPHDMDYITRSIPSLLASDLPDNIDIIIYDDCSPNPAIRDFLKSVARSDNRLRIIFGEQNKGPNLGQQDIYKQIVAEYSDAPFYLNADDDVVYHRQWLNKLRSAYEACRQMGRNGVFTALHMPFRRHFETLSAGGSRLYLKWKQPALNWLIPRDLYEEVGPFRDEGIAYDTVFSHWMRLKGYPIFCMSPSHVQNIGLLGAYATDDTTTALDYAGFSPLQRIQYQFGYHLRRIPEYLRHLTDSAAEIVWPVRWGTEFVHEGIRRDGSSVAVYSFDDAQRLGWNLEEAAKRVERVASTYATGKMPHLTPQLFRNREGTPVRVQIPWHFMPNLREAVDFNLPKRPAASELFTALMEQLAPLHEAGIAHNKIRPENIYVDQQTGSVKLMWLGVEPLPGVAYANMPKRELASSFSGALNRWARTDIREIFAERYLNYMAPEVMAGMPASPRSDIYSVAAVVLSFAQACIGRFEKPTGPINERMGILKTELILEDSSLKTLLEKCLAQNPEHRPQDASQALFKQ
ncbi:MAG: glycosyltransferase [Hydrogenophilaceae bacterium]|nr:glycosyltransferase [Hydrogenophilaceae bacterium]